jgi:hypothetical protein
MEYTPNPNKTFIDKSFQLLKNINNSAKTMDQNNYNKLSIWNLAATPVLNCSPFARLTAFYSESSPEQFHSS